MPDDTLKQRAVMFQSENLDEYNESPFSGEVLRENLLAEIRWAREHPPLPNFKPEYQLLRAESMNALIGWRAFADHLLACLEGKMSFADELHDELIYGAIQEKLQAQAALIRGLGKALNTAIADQEIWQKHLLVCQDEIDKNTEAFLVIEQKALAAYNDWLKENPEEK